MNSNRYIITRSCLEDGSMRLLKYNESLFPEAGAGIFIDEHSREFPVQIDRQRMLVTGLNTLYHDHNLGVNDVMLIHPLAANRYQVELIVKPHALTPAARQTSAPVVPTERVVMSSTPHVREVRLQRTEQPTLDVAVEALKPQLQPQPLQPLTAQKPAAQKPQPLQPIAQIEGALPAQAVASRAATSVSLSVEDQVAEFARLTGYRIEHPASGLMRLHADLGPQYSYTVLLAADPLAMTQPLWESALDEAKLLMTNEAERPEGLARLTREALATLIDHARLAPLSAVDLRGYWRSGDLDLNSASNVTELLSAHLAQRGAFTSVLLSLAQQPAHSVVNVQELAKRLGSGVNTAELSTTLETLTRPPFTVLTPLPGGHFLLRSSVDEFLGEMSEYAQGVRRRLNGQGTPVAKANSTQIKQSAEVLA